MKRIVSVSLFIMIIAAGTSCKKCYRCTVLDEDDAAAYAYPEICGTKSDFNDYQARCEAEYGSFGFDCSCTQSE